MCGCCLQFFQQKRQVCDELRHIGLQSLGLDWIVLIGLGLVWSGWVVVCWVCMLFLLEWCFSGNGVSLEMVIFPLQLFFVSHFHLLTTVVFPVLSKILFSFLFPIYIFTLSLSFLA